MKKPYLLGPYAPPAGGVATYFMRLNQLLDERGYDFFLKRMGGAEDPVQMNWHSWKTHLSHLQPDDVLFDSGTSFIENPSRRPMLLWMLWRMLKQFRWVKVLHSGTLPARYQKFTRQQKFLFRLNLQQVDEIICVNDALAQWLENTVRINKPVQRISSLLPIPTAYRAAATVELPPADYRILTIGIFTENYGFDDIVQAIEHLSKTTGHNIQLVILDAAFDRDEVYRSRILQGQPWIHVFEAISPIQVMSIMQQSNLFVRATRQESYGLSKVEALLSGLPVICTDAGETRGMITYKAGAVEDLVDKINQQMQSSHEQPEDWQRFYHNMAEENLSHIIRVLYGEQRA